jgi:cytochrome c
MEGHFLELVLGDAKRSVNKAVAFYMATGRKLALAEFSNPHGRFAEGEQYIYVLDMNGTMLAHPINEEYQGKDFYRIQDCDGKSFVKQIVDTANNNGGLGWVAYKWYDPAMKRMRPKTVYFEKVDSMIFCSGVYVLRP